MRLRQAQNSDKAFFLEVRNDPQGIRFSYSKKAIDPAAHDRWWKETQDLLYVAEAHQWEHRYAVGIVRLTPMDDACCEIHFAIHSDWRGQGLAVVLLEEGRKKAMTCGFTHIIARVDSPNTASLRAFLREGYAVTSPGTLLLERGTGDARAE